MSQREVEEELRKEFEEIAVGIGCELLDCEFKGGVLRLTIDHADGVRHDHCQTISRQVSTLLDISDFGSGRFILEVSSPGLDRKFFSDSDYGRFLGQLAKVTWKSSEMVHKQTVVGRLEAYSDSQREIVLKNESNNEAYTVSLNDIQMARLEPEI